MQVTTKEGEVGELPGLGAELGFLGGCGREIKRRDSVNERT